MKNVKRAKLRPFTINPKPTKTAATPNPKRKAQKEKERCRNK
jgi:hypothetical protein